MIVGVVTTSYPRWPGDPAGHFVAGHVAALRARGHDVEVIAAGDAARRTIEATPGHDARVVRIVARRGLFYAGGAPDRLEAAPIRGALAGAAFTARLALAIARRAARWDAIVAHWLAPSALAALPVGAPLLAIAHGGDVHTLRRLGLLGPALRALHARRAELAFVSAELRALARAAAPGLARWVDRARVQPMGIALDRFAAIARAPTTPPTILVASRLVPLKGVDVAVAALDHLRTPARLVIAGDGPARARLVAGAAAIGGDRRVALLGEVPTATIAELLGAASVVVAPSRVTPAGRSEGTPLIALEALAAGVPVVASAVGGLRELPAVRHVPPDDPRALAAAIDHVLAAPPAADALRRSVAHLDWTHIADRLLPATPAPRRPDAPAERSARRTA